MILVQWCIVTKGFQNWRSWKSSLKFFWFSLWVGLYLESVVALWRSKIYLDIWRLCLDNFLNLWPSAVTLVIWGHFHFQLAWKGWVWEFKSQVLCAVLVSSFFIFDLVGDLAIGLDQTSSVVGKFQTDFVEAMRRTNYWIFCCRLFLLVDWLFFWTIHSWRVKFWLYANFWGVCPETNLCLNECSVHCFCFIPWK
jgi:hypothetical protein